MMKPIACSVVRLLENRSQVNCGSSAEVVKIGLIYCAVGAKAMILFTIFALKGLSLRAISN